MPKSPNAQVQAGPCRRQGPHNGFEVSAGGRDLAWNLLLGAAPSLFAVPTLVRMPGIYLWTMGPVYPA